MSQRTTVCLDTDILIDVGRRLPAAVDYLDDLEHQADVAINTIVWMELLAGARNKAEQTTIEAFVTRFQVLDIDEATALIARDLIRTYRLSHGLLLPDALIAATALRYHVPLASKNQRDYRFIAHLILLPYQ